MLSAPYSVLRTPYFILAVLITFSARPVAAQINEPPPPGWEGATVIDKPNAQVPLDLEFQDEDGKTVRLGDFFKPDRPVLLALVYFRCPSICNLTLNGVVKAVEPLKLAPGRDYQIVTVSFDPREGPELAAAKKANYLKLLGKPEAAAGWCFLTSDKPAAAKTLGDAVGFGFKLDPKGEQYLHQAAIYVCAPDGRVSRAMGGTVFDADVLGDSLVNASAGKISSGLFGVAIACGAVHYDPASGKYVLAALSLMRITGIVTVIVLGVVIGTLVYRDRHRITP